jgi:hypothetical protein
MSVEPTGGHPDMDYAQHQATYASFLRGVQISVACIALVLIGMAIFLT